MFKVYQLRNNNMLLEAKSFLIRLKITNQRKYFKILSINVSKCK